MKTLLKKILPLILLCHSNIIISQTTFTKIITGPQVNDGGVSFGCSWADYDNDGRMDLFVGNMANVAGDRNFLYHNEGNGIFTKVASGSIVNDSGKSFGGSWGDYDNDGRIDLYVPNFNNQVNFLYHNDGGGNFTRILSGIIVTEGGNSNSCNWIDQNNDGNLDLCITNYGQRRFLYSNGGSGNFTKITTGAFVNDISPSLTSNWGDYNNDGRCDVFVANSGVNIGLNFLYRNDGSDSYTKIININIATDTTKSFSGSWGDYNNDGLQDLFVANDGFRNNSLYRNDGGGSFTRITTGTIVTEGNYSVSGVWADLNNDGFLDLFVTRWQNQNELLYFNNGDGTFTKITAGSIVNDLGNSFGNTAADYDNDGDLDLFVTNINNENNSMYRNNATNENQNRWINIKCVGTVSNRSSFGAKVFVKANLNGVNQWQLREISSQMGYNSQNDIRAHFGLGSNTVIDSIKVIWPGGSINTFTNTPSNQFVTITENVGIVSVNGKKNIMTEGYRLYQNYPNPFNPKTKIEFDIPLALGNERSNMKIIIYNALGKEVAVLIDREVSPGSYEVEFDGSKIPSGIYFYKLITNEFSDVRRMILLK